VTLKEIWNNEAVSYAFTNFVPPTIAGRKVLLPTARDKLSPGKVLVYGLEQEFTPVSVPPR
jgi:hypothetical protein